VCASAPQVSLYFLESDIVHSNGSDHTGFVEVHRFPRDSGPEEALQVSKWIQAQRFDVLFYPQVRRPATRVAVCTAVRVTPRLARDRRWACTLSMLSCRTCDWPPCKSRRTATRPARTARSSTSSSAASTLSTGPAHESRWCPVPRTRSCGTRRGCFSSQVRPRCSDVLFGATSRRRSGVVTRCVVLSRHGHRL
jgi:hypothetical protein